MNSKHADGPVLVDLESVRVVVAEAETARVPQVGLGVGRVADQAVVAPLLLGGVLRAGAARLGRGALGARRAGLHAHGHAHVGRDVNDMTGCATSTRKGDAKGNVAGESPDTMYVSGRIRIFSFLLCTGCSLCIRCWTGRCREGSVCTVHCQRVSNSFQGCCSTGGETKK